ncbi:hypothetical protein ACFLYU_00060 [Candidatus Dependentiae bacterium]
MQKLICTKLLIALTINLLATPFAHAGKKYHKHKYNKSRNYRRKERKFSHKDRISKKEKRRKSNWQENIEALSNFNKERNKFLETKKNFLRSIRRKRRSIELKKKYLKKRLKDISFCIKIPFWIEPLLYPSLYDTCLYYDTEIY